MYTYYITKNGKIEREGNTLYFYGEDFKQHLPVLNLSSIIILAKVSISSWAINYFSKLGIVVHFISDEGIYLSSLIPQSKNQIGQTVILQAESYLNYKKRLSIAKEFVLGIKNNILKNLKYYNKKADLEEEISRIENYRIEDTETIESLRGIEGNIWSQYYSAFPKIYKGINEFKRIIRPPPDPLNSMISYGNTVLYSTVLTSIVIAGLNPSISYIHEPSDRSFSLALDIADIFKPLIVEQLIAKIINNNMLKDSYFSYKNNGCYLNEFGKKFFLKEYAEKIESTVRDQKGKYMSYQTIILEESYKLLRALKGEIKYEAYRSVG